MLQKEFLKNRVEWEKKRKEILGQVGGAKAIELDELMGELLGNLEHIELNVHTGIQLFKLNRLAFNEFKAKKYDTAVKKFLDIANKSKIKHLKSSSFYNAACCYALSQDSSSALICLKAAVDSGYRDFERLINDKHLDLIKEEADYKEIIAPYLELKKAKKVFNKSLKKIFEDGVAKEQVKKLIEKEVPSQGSKKK